jgi:hypothetical protein
LSSRKAGVVKSSGKDDPSNTTGTGNELKFSHESGSETALEITAGAVESIDILLPIRNIRNYR